MNGPPRSRFAALARNVAPDGTDPWVLHWEARQAEAAGKDVIVLSVGDPDIDTPAAVIDAAVQAMRGGDTHYTETAGRPALRTAVAARSASSGRMCASPIRTADVLPPPQVKTSRPASL